MLENVPDEVKLKALLIVVRNLIKNSRNAEIFRLDEFLRESQYPYEHPKPISKEEFKEKIKEEVKTKLEKPKKEKIDKEGFGKNFVEPKKTHLIYRPGIQERRSPFPERRVLRIPKVAFPPHLSSVKPVPSNKVSLDLGKLNPFIQDPNVSKIETEGENEIVYVSGVMGRKPTNLKLSRVEIDEVIDRFSKEAKIPKSEGMFKVAIGKLLLTAMISESVSPRFFIEKIKAQSPQAPAPV